ncbi:FtsB family cell division protein [Vagococcus elongatus]|uniref:Septum formation initiator n=1 Tax=Vagococcus elongatus TaxID=180344 RepID=A0A430AHS1_9ENTE|nr:septum formation initiator family protein [Vagococcus elongatus]RSU07625.1 hypothetical protein CBF29_13395 [Vagococcus elongatus]
MENKTDQQRIDNVSDIDTHYTKEQRRKFSAMQKKIVYRRRRLALVFIVATVMISFLGVNIFRNVQQMQRLEKEYTVSVVERDTLLEQKAALSEEVDLLNDDEYLAKLARQKFYYSRDGETIYNIPKLDQANQEKESAADN